MYAVTDVPGERNSSNASFVQAVAEENVKLNVAALLGRNTVLKDLTTQGQLAVVGAMHDISTGKVSFYT